MESEIYLNRDKGNVLNGHIVNNTLMPILYYFPVCNVIDIDDISLSLNILKPCRHIILTGPDMNILHGLPL